MTVFCHAPRKRSIWEFLLRIIPEICGYRVSRLRSARMTTARRSVCRTGSRSKPFWLADNGDQKAAGEQALGDPFGVVDRHRIDHPLPPRNVIHAEIVALQLHEQCGDFARRVEIERERTVEIRFGFGELLGGGTVGSEAMDFLLDYIQCFAGTIVTRRRRAEEQRRVIEPEQAVVD